MNEITLFYFFNENFLKSGFNGRPWEFLMIYFFGEHSHYWTVCVYKQNNCVIKSLLSASGYRTKVRKMLSHIRSFHTDIHSVLRWQHHTNNNPTIQPTTIQLSNQQQSNYPTNNSPNNQPTTIQLSNQQQSK